MNPQDTTTILTSDPHQRLGKPAGGWRAALYAIIFESDTPKGALSIWR